MGVGSLTPAATSMPSSTPPAPETSSFRKSAIARMVQAGIKPITWVAVGAELLNNWRNPQGQAHAQVMNEHLPFYGNLFASFQAAKSN